MEKYALKLGINQVDELILIGDRKFHARPFSVAEFLEFTETANRLANQLPLLATFLGKRALDKKPVEVNWLSEQLNHAEISELSYFLLGLPNPAKATETGENS